MAGPWQQGYSPAIAAVAAGSPQDTQTHPMSGISSNPGFNAAGLDRLGSQIPLDDLHRQGPDGQAPLGDAALDGAPRGPLADPGEDVLNVAAWSSVPAGTRMLAGDTAFEHRLAALDLSTAADQGADAILHALA